jgi:FAD/FMN-containing dehydrogenase
VGLDHRATKQAWFELQQAQEAYEPWFAGQKILWPDIAMEPRWMFDRGSHTANTLYFIPNQDPFLLGYLNARQTWKNLLSRASALGDPADGGRLRLFGNTLESLPVPQPSQKVAQLAERLQEHAATTESHRRAFLRFLRQDAPWQVAPVGEKLEAFWELDEATALAEALKRRNKKLKEPTPGEREYLKRAWREAREPILELRGQIAKLEIELDAAVDAAWEA